MFEYPIRKNKPLRTEISCHEASGMPSKVNVVLAGITRSSESDAITEEARFTAR